jgi:hypothetical protein
MNWKGIYESLINKAKMEMRSKNEDCYYERHHIIPKHLGGNNDTENLVLLTFREHILAHYLLWRIHGKEGDRLMYKLRNGQKEESQRLRVELAVRSNRNGGRGFSNWKGDKHPMKNPEKVVQMLDSKRKKYEGKLMSEEARKKWYNNLNERMKAMAKDPEIQEKRSKKIKEINSTLTSEEFLLKYNNSGENNGNFGWIKGYYEVIDPNGNTKKYESQEEIIKGLNISQSFLVRNRNKGILYTKPTKISGNWNGWTFNYIQLPHPNTGKITKKHKSHKNTNKKIKINELRKKLLAK